jgi:hypothetical protein
VTTVQNTATDPGGEPLRINVRVTLMTGSPNTPGYTGSGDIAGTLSISTDVSGHWSADLTPNASITPGNTWYQVVEGQAISNIVVPASGGPYLLGDLLVTPPTSGTPLGITGVQVAADGTIAGVRPEINLISGSNVIVTATDNPSAGRVDVAVSATGGGGGAVASVNGQTGAVVLAAADVSAIPVNAEGAASGVATLDGSGHLTAAQAANLLAAANNLSDLANTTTARTNLGLGTAATASASAFDTAGSATAAQSAAQTFATNAVAGETTRAEAAEATKLTAASNLSDLGNAATARTSLGLGNAATENIGTTTGTVAAGDDSRITGAAQKSANLSDLASAATARTNLGLGTAATQASSAFDAAGAAATAQTNAIAAAESNAASIYVPLSSLPLPVASGGTGQPTQQAALTALTGAQAAGRYLRSDGANTALAAIQAADVPTLNQSTTGTAAGLSATLAVSSGGTGQVTAQAAINALTGAQSAGKFLRSDGTNATLATIQAGDVPTLNQSTTGTAAGLSTTLAIASGGTGATTAIAARANLGEYTWDTPAARGLLEYNFPPQLATVSNNLVSGSIYGVSFIAQGNSAVSKAGVGVLSSAATPTSGQNLIGLYSISGTTATQIAITGDLGTWSSQGFQSYAFGAGQTLTAGGTYLILLMSNATTPVHLGGLSTTAGFPPMYNAGLSNTAAPWYKVFLYGTAQTTLPASFTISGTTMASLNAQFPWVCLL